MKPRRFPKHIVGFAKMHPRILLHETKRANAPAMIRQGILSEALAERAGIKLPESALGRRQHEKDVSVIDSHALARAHGSHKTDPKSLEASRTILLEVDGLVVPNSVQFMLLRLKKPSTQKGCCHLMRNQLSG